MQSSYAALDHHGKLEKQRRLDRFPEVQVRDKNFGSTWQLLIRAYWFLIQIAPLGATQAVDHRSAIAEADECHDVLS
jgi:hypothetical protein